MEKKGVGRPRDGDPEETRREILKAAEQAFAASGFSGATTRQVAGDAGVNVATLHYHFGGKKGLYLAVLSEVAQGELPSLATTGTASDRLRQLMGDLFDFSARRRTLSRLCLLDDLAGPHQEGEEKADEDRRVALVASAIRTLAPADKALGAEPGLGAVDAAHLIVRLIDVALVRDRNGSGPESKLGREAGSLRAGVVAAALKIVGF